ncbi:Calx-beta domain-containing protein [Reyranella sp.]|uniref:Calx-beta domain-containing protein n=1 Tax=Reyranella sp. TaxID=1929291 RepID=UPI003784BCAB
MPYSHVGDFASYVDAPAGVTASLENPADNAGPAAGDTYNSINDLIGSKFDDTLIGDKDANILAGGSGADRLIGGNGFDYASYQFSAGVVIVSLADPALNTGEAAGDTFVSIEGLIGSKFADDLIGNSTDNWLNGGPGGDHLGGGAGADYASYQSSPIGLTISLADPGLNTGDAAGDTFVSIERLAGSQFDDVLIGNAGDNTLRGNGGGDLLDGGSGFDFASYFASPTAVTASLADPSINTGEAAGDKYISIEGLSGSAFDDVLIGDGGGNTLMGQGGTDRLDGGGGFDYASYSNATSGITASLGDPTLNTGEAKGDTYVSIEGLFGSSLDDVLIGDSQDNWLDGGTGADRLDGGAGFDYASYYESPGAVIASLANPAINTGDAAGDRYISIEGLGGSAFDDLLTGDAGTNTLMGRGGADRLDGGAGFDYASYRNAPGGLTVSLANPALNTAEAAGDTYVSIEALFGSSFDDALTGDSQGNWLDGGAGADRHDGGLGFDYASYQFSAGGLTASLSSPALNTGDAKGDTYVSIEGLVGSTFDDSLTGDSQGNWLGGGKGADRLDGGIGFDFASYFNSSAAVIASLANPSVNSGDAAGDTYVAIEGLSGSAFDDVLTGDANTNTLVGQGGADYLDGGNGFDYASYSNATSGVIASLDNPTVNTGEAKGDVYVSIEAFFGSNFDDTLVGNAVENFVGGNAGNDILIGGSGADNLDGGSGTDSASYADSAVGVTASLADPSANTGNAKGDIYTSIENLIGSSFDDALIGNGAANTLTGLAGADALNGGGGFDYASYTTATAGVTASLANPAINTGDAAGDTYVSIEGLFGSGFADTLIGNAEANELQGGTGDDILMGGLGADRLTGGTGNDVFRGTLAELDGDLILDYQEGDRILLQRQATGARFTLSKGSTIIAVDVDQDGVSDGAFTLSIDLDALLASGLQFVATEGEDATTLQFRRSSASVQASATGLPEGDTGQVGYTFTVYLDIAPVSIQTLVWSASGTGANPADPTDFGGALPSGTLTFLPGETSKTITVDVTGDHLVEFDEGFVVTLSNPTSGLALSTSAATSTILNNDQSTVSVAPLAATAPEGNNGTTVYSFAVSLDQAVVTGQTVDWSVSGSGAHPADAADFAGTLPSGTISFAAGETNKTVTVAVSADTAVEFDEDFAVTLSNASAGLTIGSTSAIGIIQNDEASVSIAALLGTKAEGRTGSTAFTFMLTLTGDSSVSRIVSYTVAGSGVAPADAADFAGGGLPAGTVTFAAGEATKMITLDVAGDSTVESDEAFTISLSNPSPGLLLGTTSALVTIRNDDTPPPVAHNDAYVVLQGHALHVAADAGVLAYDTSSGPQTATLLTGTSHGALTLASNGGLDYVPATGFTGIDNFTYRTTASGGTDDGQALVYVVPILSGTSTTLNLLALSAEEQIAATYAAFFGRAADAGGLEFWVGEFISKLPVQGPGALFANIASSFGVSAEAKALYPFLVSPFGSSDGQIGTFVDGVYRNLFNRSPDADGLAYWTSQIKQTLAAGQFVGSVLVNIMSGAQNTVDGKDITTLMAKVAVSLSFVHEQQDHHMVWSGASDITAATNLVHAITADPQTLLIGVRSAEVLAAAHD